MPNQFLFTDPNDDILDIEDVFASDYWLFEQYIGDQLYAWGSNNIGQLGDNTIVSRSTPRQEFSSSVNWKQVSLGYDQTAAIKTDGTLWGWGRNSYGQLGINDSVNISRSTPVQEITSSTNWKQVSAGNFSVAAIKTDGTLWLWGRNSRGELGVNDTVTRSTPVQEFTSSTNWKEVSLSKHFSSVTLGHSSALKTDGSLWCWGRNNEGQLGVNDRVTRSTPVREFTSSSNWKQVSAGYKNTIAIKTDGTLWGWGNNGYGQLGINDRVARSTPVREFTFSTNWKQISCGYHTSAIKTDGTLWCWGNSSTASLSGVVGDNTTQTRSTPTQEITSSTNWKQVSAGSYHTAAIKTDGTLWCWGRNSVGQLGDNTNASRSTPRQEITSSTNWKQVSAGRFHSAAIKTGINLDTGIPSVF